MGLRMLWYKRSLFVTESFDFLLKNQNIFPSCSSSAFRFVNMCTRPCGPMTIIFGSVIKNQYASLNIKLGVIRTLHVLKPQFTDLTYMGGTRSCGPIQLIFSTTVWVIEAYFQIFKSLALCVRMQSRLPQTDTRTDGRTDRRTDRHSSNVVEFCADQKFPRNIGSQIIISRCYKRIDKTNIPSLRRV